MLRKVLWALAIGATLLLALAVPEIINRKAQLAATERQHASADPIIGNFAPAPIVYKPDVFGSAPAASAHPPPAIVTPTQRPAASNSVQAVQSQICTQWRANKRMQEGQVVYKTDPPQGCLERTERILVSRGSHCDKGYVATFSLKSRSDTAAPDSTTPRDQFNISCTCEPGKTFVLMPAEVRDGTSEARAAHEWCQPIKPR